MDPRLHRVIERLLNNPSERPRLPELAKEAGMSIRMLELLFKSETRLSFALYYRQLRIARAKDQLTKTNKPVKVISSRLGYKTVEVFCRDFKRVCGCTALEYRAHSRKALLQKKSIDCV